MPNVLKALGLAERFVRTFGGQPRVFRAPGRVNLIGEHTDYNDGFVMPAAIDFDTSVAVTARDDRKLRLVSLDFDQEREFNLAQLPARGDGDWSAYGVGVAWQLQKRGIELPGANLMLGGQVPIGAGLSSSASVEVAVALALISTAGATLDGVEVARLCQRAENEFVGARCGIMDQFVSANGRSGHALLLDCRSLCFELIPVPTEVAIVICNTMVKHSIAGGEYNARRRECEQALHILQRAFPQARALRDISLDQLESQQASMPELLYRRCRHVISENERVLNAAEGLRNGDLASVGRQMAESHRSLRSDYEVSSEELDLMVLLANEQKGSVGARMTGGGFGGCTVNLVRNNAVEQFRSGVAQAYAAATGTKPEIYVSSAADGASELL